MKRAIMIEDFYLYSKDETIKCSTFKEAYEKFKNKVKINSDNYVAVGINYMDNNLPCSIDILINHKREIRESKDFAKIRAETSFSNSEIDIGLV